MSEGPSIVYKKVDPVDGGFEQKKIYVSFRTLGGLLIAFKGYHKICIRPGYRFGELKVTGFEYYNKPFGYIPFGIGYVDFHSDPPRIYSANMTPEIFDENWKRMVR